MRATGCLTAVALVGGILAAVTPAQGSVPSMPERFAEREGKATPDFQRHVVPLLGRLGCSAAKCHGSFQGQGGFRLSLFGYDFDSDRRALLAEGSEGGQLRVDPDRPDQSLILRKPTRQLRHKGGKRFAVDSWEHHLLRRWIARGAAGTETPRELDRLEVSPGEILFAKAGPTVQLRVVAVWAGGDREDVTGLCRFRSNDDTVAKVNEEGGVTGVGPGDTHVVAFYDNGVHAVPVLRPFQAKPKGEPARTATPGDPADPANPVDRFVAQKLDKLGIQPSAPCSDAEFLRRVRIDLTGTLPSVAEVQAFLVDPATDKRSLKVDALLGDPSYAAWWANKLCDYTGCSPTALTGELQQGQLQASQWYDWIRHRIERNTPYDDLVAGILLARGRSRARAGDTDFKLRETMPYYFTRQTVKEPKQKAMAVAHSFLGVQLQCAECHKHPFDRWTQTDFQEFTAFFENLGGVAEERRLELLRARTVTVPARSDAREPVMAWLREKDNPWFARAFVNRVWAGYFHRGIVDPPDAFTPANPPSHPGLLAWLTRGFLESGFDMKWLHRQIVTSETYQRSWRPNATNRLDRRNFSRAIPRRIPAEVVYDALKQVTARTDQADVVRRDLRRRASGHLSMRMAGTHAMRVFGKPGRAINCDCQRVDRPTLLQAIFLSNDPLVRMRIEESGWLEEIAAAESAGSLDVVGRIGEAFLRSVGRPPTASERTRAEGAILEAKSRVEGFQDLLWALINTKEFILNR